MINTRKPKKKKKTPMKKSTGVKSPVYSTPCIPVKMIKSPSKQVLLDNESKEETDEN